MIHAINAASMRSVWWWCWVLVVVVLVPATGVDPESGGTVQRLLSQQQSLIQPGLSFINSSSLGGVTRASLGDIRNLTQSAATVSATINIVNWSRWLLGYPVYYFKYGHFQDGKIHIHNRIKINCKYAWETLQPALVWIFY